MKNRINPELMDDQPRKELEGKAAKGELTADEYKETATKFTPVNVGKPVTTTLDNRANVNRVIVYNKMWAIQKLSKR